MMPWEADGTKILVCDGYNMKKCTGASEIRKVLFMFELDMGVIWPKC